MAAAIFEKIQMAISLQPVVRSTPCLFLEWGFPRRRIQWRYLQFEKIQDGGRRHLGKISNWHISATGRPIHCRSTPCLVLGWVFGDGGSNGAISSSKKSKMAAAAKMSNGHISATGRPIHSMFGSRVVFSKTADGAISSSKNRPPSWENFKWPTSASGRPIYSMFVSRVGFSETADLMALFPVRKIGRHLGKISNGHTSASGGPIYSMFVSIVGFSETADLIALFPVRKNPRWRPPPSWKNFKWPYLRNRSSDPLHVWF